ncbi:hypothetical protein N018_13365 [Pseudomonas syringae CC1557]|uniref:Uncharacterized protein n=1 Tax=Pseudomonas syringae CC1557 TaxID=1357279 RepID=W0N3H9_PSESX|nr:hypothetical protein [Pseudomonas syringae]AHG43616.1 hypothetical protein N018_13365 [Pseudomonas syringae CC1557]
MDDECGFMIFEIMPTDLELVIERWEFEGALSCSVNAIYDTKYAVFRHQEGVKAVVTIDKWLKTPGSEGFWSFRFSSAIYDDGKNLPMNTHFSGSRWRSKSQVNELKDILANVGLERIRPSPMPLELGLREAALALAQRFDVMPDKVKIQIHN